MPPTFLASRTNFGRKIVFHGWGREEGMVLHATYMHTQMNVHSPAACATWFLTGYGLVLVPALHNVNLENNNVMVCISENQTGWGRTNSGKLVLGNKVTYAGIWKMKICSK